MTVLSHRRRDNAFNRTSIYSQFGNNLPMSLTNRKLAQFDEYEIDCARWQLTWRKEPVPLNRKTFDLLLYLMDHRERVVSKEELLQSLWPDQFIEESNLTQHVFLLRKALSRHGSGLKLIETLPGRGYRFTAEVAELEAVSAQLIIGASESITRITFEEEQEEAESVVFAKPDRLQPLPDRGLRRGRLIGISAAALMALVGCGWFGWQKWRGRTGGPPISVVLTSLDGTTGDATLDSALLDGLRIDLAQSPFVSLISASKVRATLTEMQRKPTDPMTPTMAREVCERTNSQAVLRGTIARAGNHFLLTEEATSCVDGSVIAQAKQEADAKEQLPRTIDKLAESIRRRLGESRSSIAHFDAPLFTANTSSLEALKDYSQGITLTGQGKYPDSISLLRMAVALDPTFAAAYYQLAANYRTTQSYPQEREAILKAYNLRDSASEPIRLATIALYHSSVTEDLYDAERNYRNWTELYPLSAQAWNGLSVVQRDLGHHTEALNSAKHALGLVSNLQGLYTNVAYEQRQTGDVEGSIATCEAAIARGLDGDYVREHLLEAAYALNDAGLIQEQMKWATTHPDAVTFRIAEAEITLASGRLSEARRMIAQIDALYRHQGLAATADLVDRAEGSNLMEAGDMDEGRRLFHSVPVDPKDEVGVVGLAREGDIAAAEKDLRAMQAEFPQGTTWNDDIGPQVEALAAIAVHRPTDAVAALERSRPLEGRGTTIAKLRADAYLAAGEFALAEKAYGEIVSRVWKSPGSEEIPLSWLGLARSRAAQNKRSTATDAYQHFLMLWVHADSDATYLIQAKQELGKLQATSPLD